MNTTRRTLILTAAAALIAPRVYAADAEFEAIEKDIDGRLGVAAIDTGTARRIAHRADERFAMCSTFKWVLAAAVLTKIDARELTLDQRIGYTEADLLEYAPTTRAHVAEGHMSIADLCEAMVELSDNTAANLLLPLINGPAGLTAFVRGYGDTITRFDRTEPTLNTNMPTDPRDTTTPNAMIATMDKLLLKDVLSHGVRDQLFAWMKMSPTGVDRLRAGFPSDWPAGDKTGSGANGAATDNAIIWPPERKPILIAAYLDGSKAPTPALNAAHARIGKIVAAAFA